MQAKYMPESNDTKMTKKSCTQVTITGKYKFIRIFLPHAIKQLLTWDLLIGKNLP